jgi:hypothetical protein
MMTAKQIDQNPFVGELKQHVKWAGLPMHQFRDECLHVRAMLAALAGDQNIAGFLGAEPNLDRDNDLYNCLETVFAFHATPGDLADAIEAFDFMIALTEG